VRDRFGEKPLYVFRAPHGVYFGSEVKAIAAMRGRRLDVDYEHLCRYLVNGYKALHKNGSEFFEGLASVSPGTALVLSPGGGTRRHTYWEPASSSPPAEDLRAEDAVAGVRRELERSVAMRLRADVPAAFLMSGGVDSNSLIALASRRLQYDVHGFTIVTRDQRYDEAPLLETAIRELGIRHTAVPLDTRGFLERLRTLVRQHDAPVYTISYYVHALLMEAVAAHGFRVTISGTGADELFSGYYDHHNAYLFDVRGDERAHRAAVRAWRRHVHPHVRNPHLRDPDLFVRRPAFRDHIFLDAASFSACLRRRWYEPFREQNYCSGLLRNRMLNELRHESVPAILHEDDLNAMACSIENRSPFLDRRLFDLSRRIPTPLLVQQGYAKAVLRRAMRGIVPDAILDERRKVGFNAPITEILDVHDPQVRAAVLDDGPIYDHVRRDAVEALLDGGTLPNSRSKFLFYVLSAKLFLEEHAP
jgi:asparagine synthase (glutamine-hydrolysing)